MHKNFARIRHAGKSGIMNFFALFVQKTDKMTKGKTVENKGQ